MRRTWLVSKGDKPITRLPKAGEQAPQCKCGCGLQVEWNCSKLRWFVYYEGHYRADAPYKHNKWLEEQYAMGRTVTEIASECGVITSTVLKFIRKFGIELRSHGDSLKLRGSMHGEKNPAWKGGVMPERQKLYKTDKWKELVTSVFQRDKGTCQRCGAKKNRLTVKLHAHHIKPWAQFAELRSDLSNLITLCVGCHNFIHSNQNVSREYVSS